MKKSGLSAFQTFSLSFGCVIGWGAFTMPGSTFLKKAGPLGSFLTVQLAVFVMLLISFSYYYMIRLHPGAGGQYVYTRLAFGDTHGFICAWFLALAYFSLVPYNLTALSVIIRTVAGSVLQFGFHYSVAGYTIYGGELLFLVIVMLLVMLVLRKGISFSGRVQAVLAGLLLCALLLLIAGSLFSGKASTTHFKPYFAQNELPAVQMLSVFAICPWAFVGFETAPQYADRFRFSPEKSKVIMDLAIIIGGAVYIVLTLLSVSVLPRGFSSWRTYIGELPALSGADANPVFNASRIMLGQAGAVFFFLASFCAALTGILGFSLATVRLISLLAADRLVPKAFGATNKNGAQPVTIIVLGVLSVAGACFGRTVLSWVVDMSSVGAAIGFFYTALASCRHARKEGHKDIAVLGFFGALFSVIFILLLLIPFPALHSAIGKESWIILLVWSALGLCYYLFSKISPKSHAAPRC